MYTKEELDKLPRCIKHKKLREYHKYLKKIRKKERIKINQNKCLFTNSIKIYKKEYYKFKTLLNYAGNVKLYGYYESLI